MAKTGTISVWRIVLRVAICVSVFPIVLVTVLGILLYIPSIQQYAVSKAGQSIHEKTGMNVAIGQIRLYPPLDLKISNAVVVDTQGDTLLFTRKLILNTDLSEIWNKEIGVRSICLKDVKADTKDLIESLCIKGQVSSLTVRCDSVALEKQYVLVNEICLNGADVRMDLAGSTDTTEINENKDTSSAAWRLDIRKAEISNTRFSMNTADLDVSVDELSLSGSVDLGHSAYHADALDVNEMKLSVGSNTFDIQNLSLAAAMDGADIDVPRLHLKYGDAILDANAGMNLDSMIVRTVATATVKDGHLKVDATCDISRSSYKADIEAHDITVNDVIPLDRLCKASLHMNVAGQGFDPFDKETDLNLSLKADELVFGPVNASNTDLKADVRNAVISGFLNTSASYADSSMTAYSDAALKFEASGLNGSRPQASVNAVLGKSRFRKDSLDIGTDSLRLFADLQRNGTAIKLNSNGISVNLDSPQYALDIMKSVQESTTELKAQLDSMDIDIESLKKRFPSLTASLHLNGANDFRSFMTQYDIDFNTIDINAKMSAENGINAFIGARDLVKDTLALKSAEVRLNQSGEKILCKADVDFERQYGLPSTKALISGYLGAHLSQINLKVNSDMRDGLLDIGDLSTVAVLDMDATLKEDSLTADGKLNLNGLKYGQIDCGNRKIVFNLRPDRDNLYKIDVNTDDIPLSIAGAFVDSTDIGLSGSLKASVSALMNTDTLILSGAVMPKNVKVSYTPMDAELALGNVPITMQGKTVNIDAFPIYAIDSTALVLDGAVDLTDGIVIDMHAGSERFKPLPLNVKDSVAYHGNAAVGLDVNVSGPVDKLVVDGDVNILPETDIVYHIDKKNFVKAIADGNLHLNFPIGEDIKLTGRVNIREGQVHYSLPYYPLPPFDIVSGSNVTFNGPIKALDLDISAIQPAKAIVSETNDRTREVDFTVGVTVKNSLDNLALDFLIKSEDDAIQREINGFTQEEKNRVAATLLTTGMYLSETNDIASNSSYALASITQRSLNALSSNKIGKYIDLNMGIGTSSRDGEKYTDYRLSASKTFLDDRLKVTIGGRYSGSDSGKSSGGLDNLSVDWKVKKDGKTRLTFFHKRDYENIMDGELDKDGIGVTTGWEWKDGKYGADPYRLDFEGNISYRSNNQLGPYVSTTFSKRNLFGQGETFSAKVYGAYYCKVTNRQEGKNGFNDSFNVGMETDLSYPKILFPGLYSKEHEFPVSTIFDLGYKFEHVAGHYNMNNITGGITYACKSSKYISHWYSPLTLSFVFNDAGPDYYQQISSMTDRYKSLFSNEFIPAMEYRFQYNDTFDKVRAVNTRFDLTLKESGNLFKLMHLFNDNYNQFVKGNVELRNNFPLHEKLKLATRVTAGVGVPLGASSAIPFSQGFFIGGPNSLRGFSPRSIGPGAFYQEGYESYIYHCGDMKFEANAEFRFPLFWKLEGALFAETGNIWNLVTVRDYLTPEQLAFIYKETGIDYSKFCEGIDPKNFFNQLALDSGFGIRFVFASIVARLDIGFAIHYPYDTGKVGYYNVPRFWQDGVRLNFGIGYPF